MRYKAQFLYLSGNNENIFLNQIPIRSFAVKGGAERVVFLESTDDISLTSELEQARVYKNIYLTLPSTKDHTDMQAALDLAAIAHSKAKINVRVFIDKYSRRKFIEGLWLEDGAATLEVPPRMLGRELWVPLILPQAKLNYGKNLNTYSPF